MFEWMPARNPDFEEAHTTINDAAAKLRRAKYGRFGLADPVVRISWADPGDTARIPQLRHAATALSSELDALPAVRCIYGQRGAKGHTHC